MTGSADYEVLDVTRLRRAIGRRMRAAVTEMPHVTLHRSVSVEALRDEQARIRAARGDPAAARVTLTVLLVAIVAASLRDVPRMNGRTEDGEHRLYRQVNVAVAVALEDGLVAPVIRDADRLPLAELAVELARLTGRARAGRLSPADLADATFTITNLGTYGVEHFTPIINPPQLGILGIGAIVPTVRLVDGQPCDVAMLGLSLSFDHAVNDGAPAARFLDAVARRIESPDL
ncbi:2-oxo acid dehydrogenase subunit E2 [Actinomadura macra]|uniref:2-oxo acid dehydrogenase subunit E2 n=1 Tax=Actinomadura macra TaxID=46164 RepID=UPI00082A6F7E|nr:2-oxo acid dehydrogenase subunit E2 [Actinomadura macra]